MRKKYEPQLSIDIIPIAEVKIPENSRDELPPVLKGLQYIYTQVEIRDRVLQYLEALVFPKNNHTGRPGMSLWEILVLGVVRLCLDADYDRMEYLSNYDKLLRSILGVEAKFSEPKVYDINTIKENIHKIDDKALEKINAIIVETGYRLKKKSEGESLTIKVDSYVLETNVHFPTDINLLWDALRKCITLTKNVVSEYDYSGWRKIGMWYRQAKNHYRDASKKAFVKGFSEEKRKESVQVYLQTATSLLQKIESTLDGLSGVMAAKSDLIGFAKLVEIERFTKYLVKQIDLVERRIIKGETIPASEKIHSIFEPHTEWKQKGKAGNKVELGHNVVIATDQYDYIRHYQVVEKQADVDLAIPVFDALTEKYPAHIIESISFDKGFSSKENKELLLLYVENVIMPKRGRLNEAQKEEENTKTFKRLRNAHSAIEANINQLEHNGLNRCPDKGIEGYKRYVGFGVLAYNLHHLGKDLIAKERTEREKAEKQAKKKRIKTSKHKEVA